MLIQFKVGNYLSFKNIQTFSMVAENRLKGHRDENIFDTNKGFKLLKTCVLYGANASGKSNLLISMNFMRHFVLNSAKATKAKEEIEVKSFMLCEETENKPSFFEISFIQDRTVYIYGFELDKIKIHKEWLNHVIGKTEKNLFDRIGKKITYSEKFQDKKVVATIIENRLLRDNALLLSVLDQLNGETAKKILDWFKDFRFLHGLGDTYIFSINRFKKSSEYRDKIIEFTRMGDDNIRDLEVNEIPPEKIPFINKKEMSNEENKKKYFEILSTHPKYNIKASKVKDIKFGFYNESDGTQRLFSISAPVIHTLGNGSVLGFDEFDARLHPLLSEKILEMFHGKNKKNAQLIFTTHNTNLLSNNLFRQDQIWFTEKNRYGESDLYSFLEFKKRSDSSYSKHYLLGKYGAVPILKDMEL